MAADGLQPRLLQIVQRRRQPGDAVAVEGAGLQPGGVLGRLLGQIRLHTGAAYLEGADVHPRSDAQSAGTLRPQQAFVTGEAHHVDAHGFHVDVEPVGTDDVPVFVVCDVEIGDVVRVFGSGQSYFGDERRKYR